MNAQQRLLAAGVTAVVFALGGCAVSPGKARDVAAVPRSSPPAPSVSPVLDPPPQDGRVAGSLLRAAVPLPPGFRSPADGHGVARSGPFTLRSYVRDFAYGSKETLADLRLFGMRRGWHGYAETSDHTQWLHLYLFEAKDNYGATSFRSLLFGSRNAEPYQVRLLDDALGEVLHRTSDGRPYTAVQIAFVTGNVYAVVSVSKVGRRANSRLAERLALAQWQRLRAAIAPTA